VSLTERLFPDGATPTAPRELPKRSSGAVVTAARGSGRIPYEPSLDGIRGLAVTAVVLYHGGISWASGGYLGVDAFFVLSGYLITSLLLAEWKSTQTIALKEFWARRARRLLPALFVFLVGMAIYNIFLAKPDVLDQLRADGIATLFYVMNWRLVASSQSYFDQFFASPFRHMWSLAIEEQYYLVWPLVTLLIMRWKGSAAFFMKVCIGLAAGSALLMFVLYRPDEDPSRLYYGTDTRAQSLLVGSALAAAVASGVRFGLARLRPFILGGAAVGSLWLLYLWMQLPPTDPFLYRGGFLVLAVTVGLLIVACTQIGDNPLRRGLSFEPLRRLGIISYGVYLYHWPIFAWINADRTGWAPTSIRLLVLRLTVTLGLAVVSYVVLEKPVREGALKKLHISTTIQALLLPISAALVLLLILTSTSGAQRTTATAADFDPAKRPPPSLSGAAPAGTSGADSKILIVGDSVAYTMGVGFESNAAADNHVAVWNQAVLFCELVKGAHRENGEVRPASDTCVNWDSDWRNAIDVFKPDATVLQIGAWEIFDREINGTWQTFGSPEYDAVLKPTLQKAVDALHSQGAPVILLTTPRFTRDDGTSAKEWTQNDVSRTDHFNALLREVAANNPGTVKLIDFGEYLCPKNECRKEIDGVPMRPDGLHFKEADAKVAALWLAPQFRSIALQSQNGGAGTTPGSVAPGTTPSTAAPTPASAPPP
jgi:peptidoglycan/LPS O-acetylase OafA/YrhL